MTTPNVVKIIGLCLPFARHTISLPCKNCFKTMACGLNGGQNADEGCAEMNIADSILPTLPRIRQHQGRCAFAGSSKKKPLRNTERLGSGNKIKLYVKP